uniref:Lipoprotein n=1 Tax=Mycoplasma feriruminatoris TaxID=1179777 RepID=A0A654IP96_9MOLU|nr:hypothetical protein MF5582_00719 [Mycoplasma feriruminatoris]
MKKILTILSSFSLIAISSVLVVSCKADRADKKIEQPGRTPESKMDKEEDKKDSKTPDSRNEMSQGDQPRNDSKNGSNASKHNNNIFSSTEEEGEFIKKYYERLGKKKTDNVPHLFNPKDPNEIFALGYEKEKNKKDSIKLKQIPKNVKKVPNFLPKNITSLESAFKGNLNKHIEGIESWDISNVKSLYQTFFDARNFNGDITKWQTQNVEDFNYMLSGTNSFDRDLSKWKVTKRPFQVGFAKNSTFDKNRKFWPPFKNKNN